MWRFYLIPQTKHSEILELHAAGDWQAVMVLYNRHKVSPDVLTTCCSRELVIQWTDHAIQEGWLQQQ